MKFATIFVTLTILSSIGMGETLKNCSVKSVTNYSPGDQEWTVASLTCGAVNKSVETNRQTLANILFTSKLTGATLTVESSDGVQDASGRNGTALYLLKGIQSIGLSAQ